MWWILFNVINFGKLILCVFKQIVTSFLYINSLNAIFRDLAVCTYLFCIMAVNTCKKNVLQLPQFESVMVSMPDLQFSGFYK